MREWLQSMPIPARRVLADGRAGRHPCRSRDGQGTQGLVHHGIGPPGLFTGALGDRHLLRSTPHAGSEFSGEIRTRDGAECDFDYGIAEGDAPPAGPGHVQIKVAACGIGYVDVLVALGGYQVKPTLPHTPGQEIAGTVSAIGSGVTGLSVGDRVLAAAQGGFAEYAVAKRDSVFGIPDSLAFASAAACGSTTSPPCTACATARTSRRVSACWCWAQRAAWASPPSGRQAFGRRGHRRGLDRGEAGLRARRRRRPGPRQRRRGMARAAEGHLQRRRAGRDLRSVVRAIVRAGLPLARLARAASRRRLRRRRDARGCASISR